MKSTQRRRDKRKMIKLKNIEKTHEKNKENMTINNWLRKRHKKKNAIP